jgi:hypothetical protein
MSYERAGKNCSTLTAEIAQVGEWLKPTDCKSVPPSEVRRFESSPVHQFCCDHEIGNSVHCVRRARYFGIVHVRGSAIPLRDVGNLSDAGGEDLGSTQGFFALR